MKRRVALMGFILDGIAVFMAMVVAAWLKFDSSLFPEAMPMAPRMVLEGALFSLPFWWAILFLSGAYRPHWDMSWADELRLVMRPVTTGFIVLFFGAFLIAPSTSVGRWIIIFYYALLILFLFASRGVARLLERRLSRRGRLYRKALVVGTGEQAVTLAENLRNNPALGYRIVGFVEADGVGEMERAVPDEAILGGVADLEELISGHGVDELLVTIASNFHEDILSLLLPAAVTGARVKAVPDLFDVVAGHVHSTQIMGQPLMSIMAERLSYGQKLLKVFMDYGISIVTILAGMPLWIIVAAAIRLDSRGPVFYRQERVGLGGKVFRIYKFRSMVQDAESKSGPVWAGRNDPRVTRVGKLLRRTRLDEVPQLLNVLAGDMSVVGPRPERPAFVEDLRKVFPFYAKRLTVKPGLTGWAQVKLEYDTDLDSVADKLKFDFFYIENRSIYLDIEILARTLKVVLTGAGAH